MYLKIEVDGEEQFYSFENKKIVTIGRAPECDVQLLVEGVSRDHLLIMETELGEYKFIDLGSTNGTYVNGQLIDKDVETDFNSFFPVKLGSQVYVYLIDQVTAGAVQEEIAEREAEKRRSSLDFPVDESAEAPQEPVLSDEQLKEKKRKQMQDRIYVPKNKPVVTDHETTRVIKRPTLAVSSSSAKKKSKKAPNKFTMLLGLLAGIGIAYYFSPKETPPVAQKSKAPLKEPIKPKVKAVPKSLAESMMGIVALDKCLGEIESALCSEVKKIRPLKHKEGFLKFASKLYLVVRLEGVAEGYEALTLSSLQEAELLKAMALNLGRQFSETKIKKNNLIFQKPDLNSDLSKKSALFIDLAASEAYKKIEKLEGVSELTVILVKGDEFIQIAELKSEQFKELNNQEFARDLVHYWRSGLSRPLTNHLSGNKGKTLISSIKDK